MHECIYNIPFTKLFNLFPFKEDIDDVEDTIICFEPKVAPWDHEELLKIAPGFPSRQGRPNDIPLFNVTIDGITIFFDLEVPTNSITIYDKIYGVEVVWIDNLRVDTTVSIFLSIIINAFGFLPLFVLYPFSSFSYMFSIYRYVWMNMKNECLMKCIPDEEGFSLRNHCHSLSFSLSLFLSFSLSLFLSLFSFCLFSFSLSLSILFLSLSLSLSHWIRKQRTEKKLMSSLTGAVDCCDQKNDDS